MRIDWVIGSAAVLEICMALIMPSHFASRPSMIFAWVKAGRDMEWEC